MLPLRFIPYHRLDEVPNVVVDGSPNAATVLTLSHWPGSPTPAEVLDDLSAQIAFHALEHPAWFSDIGVVTNNHFDQDGLCSAYILIEPEAAVARFDRVVDVARAGDFGTFVDRDSARLAFAIAAHEDPSTSPLDPAVFEGSYPEQCGRLYEALLPTFGELLDHPERCRELWEDEDAHLAESLAAIEGGTVRVDERPAIDLAVFTVPDGWAERATHRFTQSRDDAVHPMAVNQASPCLRTMLIQGHRYRLEFRYESWVMMRSRPVAARPDLRVLANHLNELEPNGSTWQSSPPGALTPRLELVSAESGLSAENFRSTVEQFLETAPPAWDPFEPR